jgi:uncharacterized protein (DUF1015 family)
MRLFAFEGLHYSANAGDPSEIGELAAPPYDQINDSLRDRFHTQSPHQFVHLTKPVAPEGGDPYRFAAALHHRWLNEGVIERDPRPAIYPYVIELAGGGERLGLLGLVGYEDASVIRPHEQTLDKPLADRTALLEATRVDLEPVLLLSEDQGRLDALLREDLKGAQPLVRHRDADGHFHVLYRIDDPARIALYKQVLDVLYRSNPDELWSQVAAGDLGTGLWLPPMTPAAFSAAIAGGEMLPPKSTRFLPKVMSGLVWADHDSKVE